MEKQKDTKIERNYLSHGDAEKKRQDSQIILLNIFPINKKKHHKFNFNKQTCMKVNMTPSPM